MKAVTWFYSGCAALVIVIYWATNTWPVSSFYDFAEYAFNQDEKWWQGWIGALSGWAGATGALIAAGWTISKLNKQISEQIRQTDYVVGDALPSMEISVDTPVQAKIMVQNLNRRRIEILEIQNLCNFDVEIMVTTGPGFPNFQKTFEGGERKSISKLDRVFVDGNVEPNSAPPTKMITMIALDGNPDNSQRNYAVRLTIKLRDEVGSVFALSASDFWTI